MSHYSVTALLRAFILLYGLSPIQPCGLWAHDNESEDSDGESIQIDPMHDNHSTACYLTVGEAAQFLFNYFQPAGDWVVCGCEPRTFCSAPTIIWIGLGGTAVLSLVVGGLTELIVFGGRTPDSSWSPTTYPPAIAGYCVLATAPALLLLAACYHPFAIIRNLCAKSFRARLRKDIAQNFTAGRLSSERLTEADLRYVGPLLIKAQSQLLNRLPPTEAVFLAGLYFSGFTTAVQSKLNEEGNIKVDKLRRMVETEENELAIMLSSAEYQEFLSANLDVFEALIRALSERQIAHEAVAKELESTLTFLALNESRKNKNEDAKDVIAHIRSGMSIHHYVKRSAKRVLTGDEIELITTQRVFTASGPALMWVSGFFAKALSDQSPTNKSHQLELPNIDEEWVALVVDVARGKRITTNLENLAMLLDAALYFSISSVLAQCDRFIKDIDLLKKPPKDWTKKVGSTFDTKWHFCNQYSLTENKRQLVRNVLEELESLKIKDETKLINLRLLKIRDIALAPDGFREDAFDSKLADPLFLRWIWECAKDIEFLREKIRAFCAKPSNHAIVERAWTIRPKDL